MAKPAARIIALQALLALGGVAIVARAFQVQVIQYAHWHKAVETLRTDHVVVPAIRGTIFDRNGIPLAATQELYRLRMTSSQLTNIDSIRHALVDVQIPREKIETQLGKPFPYFSELLTAEEVEPFRHFKGIAIDVELHRIYPLGKLALPWLGGLDDHGRAVGGIESALDTVLTGIDGKDELPIDGFSRRLDVPGSRILDPIPGKNVYLTIDAELQGIVESELFDEVEARDANGGDVVIVDIHTGEVLAIASLRRDSVTRQLVARSTAAVEPNEPGSTAKIFTAAALLRYNADTMPVPGHGGTYRVPNTTRDIYDVHPESGMLSLGETIKVSSNIAISQFSFHLGDEDQYNALRDFGFGTPAGIGIPGEASGVLYRPPWTNRLLSKPSLAQGYEWMATALQLASGYAAIANDGLLLSPSLIKSVKSNGAAQPSWQHSPMSVRQVVTPAIARQLRAYLALVTDSGGSGTKAQLDRYSVIGKTGTAKFHDKKGYRASFAGMFPGDAPQVVVYVMIDQPKGGEIYGGLVAAPIVRKILLQGLATQNSPIDRSRISSTVAVGKVEPPHLPGSDSAHSVNLPIRPVAPPMSGEVLVPELNGLSIREAVATLQHLGLRVRINGVGLVTGVSPASGASVPSGSTITLQSGSNP